MKILIKSSNIDDYCYMLEKSIDRFIEYAEKYSCKNITYTSIIWLAEWVKDNYRDKIALHILSFASSSSNYFLDGRHIFPHQVLQFLYDMQNFVFDNSESKEPLSIEEQNARSKAYVHFDFSVKKATTIEKDRL